MTTRLRAIFLHSVGTLPFLGRPAKTGRAEARKREGEGKGGRGGGKRSDRRRNLTDDSAEKNTGDPIRG